MAERGDRPYEYRSYMIERWPSGGVSVTRCTLDRGAKRMRFERLLEDLGDDLQGTTDRALLELALTAPARPVHSPGTASPGQLELPLDPPKG